VHGSLTTTGSEQVISITTCSVSAVEHALCLTHTHTDPCLLPPIYGVIFSRAISFLLSETQSPALSPCHLTSPPAFGSPSTTFLQPQPSLHPRQRHPSTIYVSSSPFFPALFWFSSCLPSPVFSLSICHDVAFHDKIRFHDPKTRRYEMRTSFFSFGGHQRACVYVYCFVLFMLA
jgi:hypothetical protein